MIKNAGITCQISKQIRKKKPLIKNKENKDQPEVEVTAINHRRLGADYYAGRDTEDILSEIERILLGKDDYFYSDDEDLIEKSK